MRVKTLAKISTLLTYLAELEATDACARAWERWMDKEISIRKRNRLVQQAGELLESVEALMRN